MKATPMTEDQSTSRIEGEADDRLAKAWMAAVERTQVGPGSVERAKFLGYNVCIKIPEVFAAAVDTVKAGGSVLAAIAFPAAWPATVPLAVWESYCVARTVFSALVERMAPLEYVTVVILATHTKGIEEADLANEIEAFVKDPNTRTFSWHLGMSEEIVDDARGDIHTGWITRMVDELNSKGFVDIVGGKLFPKSKNVEWKFGF
jgi:hypothetical protein